MFFIYLPRVVLGAPHRLSRVGAEVASAAKWTAKERGQLVRVSLRRSWEGGVDAVTARGPYITAEVKYTSDAALGTARVSWIVDA